MTIVTERTAVGASSSRGLALRSLPASAALIDLALIGLIVLAAALVRTRLTFLNLDTDITDDLLVVGPVLTVGWLVVIALLGGYRWDVFGSSADEYRKVLNASLLTSGLLGVGCYLVNYSLPRGFFLLVFLIGIPALLVGRFVFRRVIHRARLRGHLLQRAVIAGSPPHIDEVAAVLRREPWLGYDVIGALTPAYELGDETCAGLAVLGNADDVVSIATESQADVIFFAGGALGSAQRLREIIWELEQDAFRVVVAPSVSEISSERIRVRPIGGLPLMHVSPPTWVNAARIGKRIFDLVGSGVLLVLLSPLLLGCALSIRRHDGGPVLFRHTRVGRDGREFDCLKFRTMVVDAEAMAPDLQREHGQAALLFKVKGDPRITPPGHWLRRFSVDELPQLLNVLRGDMSLVGPRPQVLREVQLYIGGMNRRLRVRPGMTGLWQVSGRNDLTVEEAMRLDLYYVDNWSMLQDLGILARTVGAVLSARGAY